MRQEEGFITCVDLMSHSAVILPTLTHRESISRLPHAAPASPSFSVSLLWNTLHFSTSPRVEKRPVIAPLEGWLPIATRFISEAAEDVYTQKHFDSRGEAAADITHQNSWVTITQMQHCAHHGGDSWDYLDILLLDYLRLFLQTRAWKNINSI